MARHRVTINPLDPASIDAASAEIQRIFQEFNRKVETYLDRLAEVGQQTAQGGFGGQATVTVERTPNGRRVVASGGDTMYFVEFGTGMYAGSNGGQYLEFPSDVVYPGSYSESEKGKHTWSAWINAGNGEDSYPYNSAPQSPMYKAYEAMCQQSAQIAREVFGT